MFYYLDKDTDQHISFYSEMLKKDFLVFGVHNIPLDFIVRKQVFQPLFQLVFLDALRKSQKIQFNEMKFSVRLDKSELFGIKNLDFSSGKISEEFVTQCINNEEFFDSIRSHSIWFRLSSFLNLAIDGDQASLLGLSLFMRHIFWQKKLVSDYVLSPDDTEDFGFFINQVIKTFHTSADMSERANQFVSERESREVNGFEGIDDIGDGIPAVISHLISELGNSLTAQNSADESEADFEFEFEGVILIDKSERKIQSIKPKYEIELSLSSKGYREFISKLVLVTFGRLMTETGLDLKTDADQIFKKIEVNFFDIQAAVFSSRFVSERWALKLKKTSSSLIYHDSVYELYEKMADSFSARTYDHPKRGNTVHCFRHFIEYEEAVHRKFIDFVQSQDVTSPQKMNENNFSELLWDMLSSNDNCAYSSYFIENNTPQSLRSIKLACNKLSEYLHDNIKGQNEAIRQIVNAEMWSKFKSSKGLRGLFTFLGPSGVGKTHLAKTYAEALKLYDLTGYKVQLFNMESYSDERAASALIGAGSQYTDASAGELTFNVHLYPRTVVVFY